MASIINHQFKIIGENITFEDLSETGEIEIGKNKIMWYDYYKFPSKEKYEEWKKWAKEKIIEYDCTEKFDTIDMLYGLHYKIDKIKMAS